MKDRVIRTDKRISWRRTYLPLILVPLLLCIILSVAVYSVAYDQLKTTGQMNVEKFHAQANGILNELKIVNDSLLSNDNFISLITKDSVSEDDITAISRTLRNQLKKSAYVQDAFVISRPHGLIYSNEAHFSYRSLVPLLHISGVIQEADSTISEDDLQEGWTQPANSYSSPYYVSYINDNDGNKAATLVVVLTKGYLYRSLFITNSVFCCMYNDNFLLSTELNADMNTDFTSETAVSELVGEPVKIFTIEADGYTFLTAMSRSSLYRPIYMIFAAFGIYIVLIILYSLIHIHVTNKKEREFFSSLISELPQPITGNPDIQTIMTSIQEALENYKEEHSAFSEQQKYNDLNKLAHGNLGPKADDELLNSMNVDPDAWGYYVLRFVLMETGIVNPYHRDDLLCIIIETALNGFSENRFKSVCFPQKHGDICGILNIYDPEFSSDYINDAVSHVQTMLIRDYGTISSCSISSPVERYQDIPVAWNETSELISFVHAIDSNTSIISADNLKNTPGILIKGEFLKQLQVLSNTLLLGKHEMVSSMTDAILEEHVAPIRKDFNRAQERLQCIVTVLREAPYLESFGSDAADALHAELKEVDSISRLSSTVHKYFDNTSSEDSGLTPVSKACDYIHTNVSNINLSVPEIAEAVGISVQHLSKLFKADKGMTMVEYINLYRINMAQDLLLNTSTNVNKIAEQTGYNNIVTFSRNFRRFVGCTPTEFRETNQK